MDILRFQINKECNKDEYDSFSDPHEFLIPQYDGNDSFEDDDISMNEKVGSIAEVANNVEDADNVKVADNIVVADSVVKNLNSTFEEWPI